jgi:UV DNA damage endonuclease
MLHYARNNLRACKNILRWNDEHDIRVFRISSSMVPFASHPANKGSWKIDLAPLLAEIGEYAMDKGMRLSMHPGQYTVLNSQGEATFKTALADLDYHTSLLELMGLSFQARIILHCGGRYGDLLNKSLQRLEERYLELPERIRRRIAFENDEKVCGADILDLCKRIGAPRIFDVFHHRLHPSLPRMSEREIIEAFAQTWPEGERQKIHYSDQNPCKPKGSHSDHVDLAKFLDFYQTVSDTELEVMLEAKDKERSVLAVKEALSDTGIYRTDG